MYSYLTCRGFYVIADVIADARGVTDVMTVTSGTFQSSGKTLTQRVQSPLAMKALAGGGRRRRGRRHGRGAAGVDVDGDRGERSGGRGRRDDRVHLAEHNRYRRDGRAERCFKRGLSSLTLLVCLLHSACRIALTHLLVYTSLFPHSLTLLAGICDVMAASSDLMTGPYGTLARSYRTCAGAFVNCSLNFHRICLIVWWSGFIDFTTSCIDYKIFTKETRFISHCLCIVLFRKIG